jgi:hypothetical protein
MTISDLLTLIGILLAIFAFISERNREYVFLKFSKVNLFVLVFIFLYIHFLISYDWWKNILPLNSLEFSGFPSASSWAYIFSVSTLIYATYKVFWAKFPLDNREKLMVYYEKLLLRNESAFVSELVEKFHSDEIVDFLQARKTLREDNQENVVDEPDEKDPFSEVLNTRSRIFGGNVYSRVIISDCFIDEIAGKNPYLFTPFIKEMNSMELRDEQFVNRFLKVLMLNKNRNFFREIRNNTNLDHQDSYRIEKSRPILFALFSDINVVHINQAWRGIGEQAILEMHSEVKREYSALRESDREQENDTIWTYGINSAIWYFDIMVRRAIVQGIEDHMWMYYYRHFVETILANMDELPFEESESNRSTRNFDLVEDIFTKMMDWKRVSIKSQHYQLIESIYDCIGQCIYELTISTKLNWDDKLYLVNWVWEDLIRSHGQAAGDVEHVEAIMDAGILMFSNPSNLFLPTDGEEGQLYRILIEKLWEDRDTPILVGQVGGRAERFRTEVVLIWNPVLG